MNFRIYLFSFSLSILIGFFWLLWAHLYSRFSIPFSVSGLLVSVWFLPGFVAAYFQKRASAYFPGLIFISEALAALISGAFGSLGWLSFQFGLLQAFAGEFAFYSKSSFWSLGLAMLGADLFLMFFHPQLQLLRSESSLNWVLHILGAGLSSFAMIQIFYRIKLKIK